MENEAPGIVKNLLTYAGSRHLKKSKRLPKYDPNLEGIILRILRDNPMGITVRQLLKKTGQNDGYVRTKYSICKSVFALQSRGAVECIRSENGWTWTVRLPGKYVPDLSKIPEEHKFIFLSDQKE